MPILKMGGIKDATERSPLLANGCHLRNGDSIPNGNTGNQNEGDKDATPLAWEPSTRTFVLILSSTWLSTFFAALDMTIVATLTTPISSEFKSLSLLSWLASGYLIANAAGQPLAGKLTDIFSRRNGLVFSNIVFGAGCLICGLATNQYVIIAGRVISGVGGGGLNVICTIVTSDLVPLRTRGLWQGFGNVIFGVGMALGGVAGGWLNDTLGWRWAFLIQVPFVVVNGLLSAMVIKIPVKETGEAAWKRVDFSGAALLTLALVLFLLGVNTGGNQLPWSHPLVVTSLPLSALCLVLFVYVEDKLAIEPIIPVRLLLRRTVWAACFTTTFGNMAIFIMYFYLPFYLQIRGESATEAGLRLIPPAFAASIGSVTAGILMRTTGRYYFMSCVAMAFFVAGAALLSTLNYGSPTWQSFVYMIPSSFGQGAIITFTLVALIAAVDHRDQAVITSASYAFRSTGSTVGVTVGSAVFQNSLQRSLMDAFAKVPQKTRIVKGLRDNYREIARLASPFLRDKAIECYMGAFRATFLTALGMAVLGSLTILFMEEHKLYANLARK